MHWVAASVALGCSVIPPLSSSTMQPSRDLSRLIEIMAALRDPETGCPWDLEQDFASIRHYTIEEAYEVADAIERRDFEDLRLELGDLLLQPIYHAQMASERGLFDIGDVILAITEKLIRRHPHVFGPEAVTSAGMAKGQWDKIKADERAAKAEKRAADAPPPSILDDVPSVLPALARAEKLSRRAASVGFDWPDWRQTLSKVREELDEIEGAVAEDRPQAEIAEELGDLLFAASNLARQLGVDAEAALRDANLKFTRRFNYVEARAREDDIAIADAGLARLDGYWNEIREADKKR
jgi:ATP diphosphatase